MEGLFRTQPNAPLAIIGMPDTDKGILLDPIEIPGVLSFLIYGTTSAMVTGLNDIPLADQPPVDCPRPECKIAFATQDRVDHFWRLSYRR
jgi:cytochrome d ubiquinol oxidase subunit I